VFYQHAAVNKVAVIGIPDKKRGENVKAFVTLKEGQKATADELMKFCQERLAKYKWPVEIEIRDALPESNVGKILKKELRAELAPKTAGKK
jgi:long-chain acyl-CoA synthetase